MFRFRVFVLDKHHMIGKFLDIENRISWQMITTNAPIIYDKITNSVDVDGGAGFDMYEIDPNCFEWNGQKLRLEES